MSILLASGTAPFTGALVLIVVIAGLEIVGLLSGFGIHTALDNLMPDGGDVLGWLHVGQVPALVLVLLLLSGFALAGYALQFVVSNLSGDLLPAAVACIPAAAGAVAFTRVAGGAIARAMPGTESEAVSEASFVGRRAVVVSGVAERGRPAQARLHDEHGLAHYVMVEPDRPEDRFESGSDVVLVRRIGARFAAVADTHPDPH